MTGESIALIVPAAGLSTRYPPNKLLHILGNESVVCKTLAVLDSKEWQLHVILGYMAQEVKDTIENELDLEVRFIYNDVYADGMSTSVKSGVQEVGPGMDYYAFYPADKPFIRTKTLERCFQEIREKKPRILIPRYEGKNGHPSFFAGDYFKEFLMLGGDAGGRNIVSRNESDVRFLDLDDEGIVLDMDAYFERQGQKS